ncbi:MAG: hypothetical protein PHC88_00435 [Terrimicrobiaceae bacterium]|nr:hypothetical protein [Terrimicrobiaceae bacterium]
MRRRDSIPPLALATLSGAAGLAHQLLWVRRMIDVLGADAGTFSRVIGAFFLGLSLGAWWAARRATPRPWRSVALAECLVAALAFVVLAAGQIPWPAWPWLSWALPLALVLPPAAAMGAVLPWMIRAAGASRSVSLYAANIFGGVAGLVVTFSWSLPALGLAGASGFTLALNLVVAAVAWRLQTADEAEATPAADAGASSATLEGLAFASGFLVLAAEVIFQHQFAQFLISSHLAGALVLALALAALGAASAFVALWRGPAPALLPAALFLAAIACAAQPLVLVVQRGGVHYLAYAKPLGAYLADAVRLGAPALFLVLLPAGLVFPLLLREAAARRIDAGRLLAVNGLGGCLGAELGERLLTPMFGIWFAMSVLAGGYLLCLGAQAARWRWIALALGAAVVAWSWRIDARLPYIGLAGEDALVKVAMGREGVVAVVHGEPDDWRLVVNNSYTLGGSRAAGNQEREALLPILLHGDARRVATLGVATGSTVAGAALDPEVEAIEGIDLSPLVLGFARNDFAPFNRSMAADPRVRLTRGDARRVIRERRGAFDVVVGDLFLPWNTGEGRLFTREHFAGVRAALRPGGLYCQWLPMYQLTRAQFDAILRTFRIVFPDAWIVRGDFYVGMPIIGLVGGKTLEQVDWKRVAAACERVRATGKCLDPLLRHADGVAMYVVGSASEPPKGPVITLANSWIEWDAARNVIGLREKWFAGLPLAEYLRSIQRASSDRLPTGLRPALACADRCVALEVARAAGLPQAGEIEVQVVENLPAPLVADGGANWSLLPMQHRPAYPPGRAP